MRSLLSRLLMFAVLTVPLAAAAGAQLSAPEAPATALALEPLFYPIPELHARYGDAYTLEPGPAGLDPVDSAAYWMDERDVNGNTVSGWVRDTQATYGLAGSGSMLPEADLVAEMMRLYSVLGYDAPGGTEATVAAAAAGIPGGIEGPFAGLLQVVVDAYSEQAARAEVLVARVHGGFTFGEVDDLVTREERDAMQALEARVLDALLAFDAATADDFELLSLAAGGGGPLFVDPVFGTIILGGMGDNTYVRDTTPVSALLPLPDPILTVEPAGNDTYLHSAGGACPDRVHLLHECNGIALAIVHDLAGHDLYRWDGAPMVAQGSGSTGGVGMLVDAEGNDTYYAQFTRTTKSAFFQYLDGGAQGYGQVGAGLLIDGSGDDLYSLNVRSAVLGLSIWGFGQGFGNAGSVGIAMDLGGKDEWLARGWGGTSSGQRFQGLYPQGTGFYGGVGLIFDLGRSDDYYWAYVESITTDYYAQGFGAFGGLGVQLDDGGDDDYYAAEHAHNPFIDPLLNCAFGTASYAGVGVFLELAGDDSYYGETISTRRAMIGNEGFGGPGAAYGLHVDLEGDDRHVMRATGTPGSYTAGRGMVLVNGNIVGNYLDAGGIDYYEGPGYDGGHWAAGADKNLVPGGIL